MKTFTRTRLRLTKLYSEPQSRPLVSRPTPNKPAVYSTIERRTLPMQDERSVVVLLAGWLAAAAMGAWWLFRAVPILWWLVGMVIAAVVAKWASK